MSTSLRLTALFLALSLSLPACSIAAHATPQNLMRAQVEQGTIDDITGAQAALSNGHPIAALTDTENAETTLLNAQQAGILPYTEIRTLTALSWADSDLQNGLNGAAASELQTAFTDLS